MTLLHQAAQKAVEAARIAFERDAQTRYPGLRLTRSGYGYVNPCWDEDWQKWLRAWESALQQQPEPVGHVVVDMQSNGPGDRIKWTKLALEHGTPLYASPPAIQQPAFTVIDKVRDLRDVQGQQGLGADSYMRGLYNGLELALCTLEERDPIYAESAALQHQEVPREPVAWYEQMRLTLIGQVHELLDIAERHAWTRDPEEKRRTEGAIAHARKVTAPYNYNGAASPSTTRQQEVGSGSVGGAMFKAEHEFLEWNRAQPAPLVKVAYEYGVFRKAVDLYFAAAPSTPEKAGGVSDGVKVTDAGVPPSGADGKKSLPDFNGYTPDGPVGMALEWLESALACPAFQWDGDQREYAEKSLKDAEQWLADLMAAHPLPAQANDGGEHG